MDNLTVAKNVVAYSASFGAASIVGTTCAFYTPKPTSLPGKFIRFMGVYGLAGLAGNAVHKYVEKEFDDMVLVFKKAATQEKS